MRDYIGAKRKMNRNQTINELLSSTKYLLVQKNLLFCQISTHFLNLVSKFCVDIIGKYNGNLIYLNFLSGIPKLIEVQAAELFNIDAIDFDFTEIAYGAWRPRIL